jgi:hypothetical protein
MSRTYARQETQIRASDLYDDTIAPTEAAFETNPVNIEDDINNVRSMLSYLKDIQSGNWWDAQTAPSTLEAGSLRGVDNLNDALHLVEKKRVLRCVWSLTDVTVPGAAQHVVLTLAQVPTQDTIAVGAVTTLGTVAADHSAAFNTASAAIVVPGSNAVSPKNLVPIVDGTTRDPILDSGGKTIYGLLQAENATDGFTATGTTPNRLQLSFVVVNGTGDGLQLAAGADIGGKTINFCTNERVRLEDLNEEDFLNGAVIDVPGASTVTRQVGYDNQGVTPVNLVTNATLDLEGAGLAWVIRDDLEANLFGVVEGSAGGTSQVNIYGDVDEFDIDAAVNDFLNGASFDTGAAGTTIKVGVTANQIDSGGALTLTAVAQLLLDSSGDEVHFDDVYRSASTWGLASMSFADSAAEWTAYEDMFGEVSLLAGIVAAGNLAPSIVKTCANVVANVAADTDISLSDANLDAALGNLSLGTFVDDYDIYLNGRLQRNGADAAANNDVYPGTDLNNGGDAQLKFEKKVKTGDVICVIARA